MSHNLLGGVLVGGIDYDGPGTGPNRVDLPVCSRDAGPLCLMEMRGRISIPRPMGKARFCSCQCPFSRFARELVY